MKYMIFSEKLSVEISDTIQTNQDKNKSFLKLQTEKFNQFSLTLTENANSQEGNLRQT